MRCLELPFRFDPEKLRTDLARVRPDEWIPHIQRKHYDGQWSGAPLRAIGGNPANIIPEADDPSMFQATPILQRCAYFQEVLATFECPQRAVRLLRLYAGSSIAEHVDRALDFEDGEVRIHIPIITHEEVKFFLDGSRLIMAPGECWYTNVNLPHSVENRSPIDRIHLVIDCGVNDWLRKLFESQPPRAPDFHSSILRLPANVEPSVLFEALNGCAAELTTKENRVRFLSERNVFVLQWGGGLAWQVRLRLASDGAQMRLELESSPDPDHHRRGNFDGVLECLQRTLPGVVVSQS